MSATLKAKVAELNDQIAEKNKDAAEKWAAFEKAREDFVAAGNDANNTESDAFKAVHVKHEDYGKTKDEIDELERVRDATFRMAAAEEPKALPPRDPQVEHRGNMSEAKSFADRVLEAMTKSEDYERVKAAAHSSSPIGQVLLGKASTAAEMKSLITGLSNTSAGAFIDEDRKPYVDLPRRPTMIRNLITVGTTDSDTVKYARQTDYTPVAAETAEATALTTGTKPEAAMGFELVTEAVTTIPVWIPSTRQALADVGQLRTMIESQLRYDIEYRVESEITAGDGTGENFEGILSNSNIQSQALGSDTRPDAVHKALTKLRLLFYEPSAAAFHPNDWQEVALSKTSDGVYYWGGPAVAQSQQIWGLPAVTTPAVTEGTSLVGDFRQAVLWIREGITLYASDSHDDFFIKNLVAVLAEMRGAFGVLRPKAFCKVTGM